jgi:hypothetical protein
MQRLCLLYLLETTISGNYAFEGLGKGYSSLTISRSAFPGKVMLLTLRMQKFEQLISIARPRVSIA